MIIGTAGHIDHGKTSLVRKLTGIDTDRLKEEKARGISIDLGFAYWPRPNGSVIGFVDVPGHEGLVHNMLAGATGIDFVILAVAADDGIMPQTREHLAIMDLLGLERGIVALTKCDLAGESRIAEVSREIEALLAGTSLEGAETVRVSAVTGAGIDDLAARIDEALAASAVRSSEGRFRLAVDRAFTIAGHGPAVTGTVLSGAIEVGDRVTIGPAGLEARVRSIHAQNRTVERGEAGQRCALVLSGPRISKESLHRGDMVLDPVLHAPSSRIDARLRVLRSERKPVGQWFPVKVHHAASEVPSRIVVLSSEAIDPGDSGLVQLVLERPIAAAAGDRFVLRDTSSSRTVGGGAFIDLRAPERRRRRPERLAAVEALAEKDPLAALTGILDKPNGWIDLGSFLRDRVIGEGRAAAIVSALKLVTLPMRESVAAMLEARWQAFRENVLGRLDIFHAENPDLPGAGLEQLRRAANQPLPAPLFAAAMRKLAESGDAALDRMWVRRPGHSVKFTPEEERLLAVILRHLKGEPYRPPRVRDVAKAMAIGEDAVRRLLRMSCRRGEVEEMAHDHFFLRSTVEAMARIAIELAAQSPKGTFAAAEFRDRLDNGRKVAIQILEFFDRHGFTVRRQDLRRINPARIALFVPQSVAREQGLETNGGVLLPVGQPVLKTGWGCQTVSGGFDSHPPPPPPSQEVSQ
jgi:selenocysteine-specific elongation factor